MKKFLHSFLLGSVLSISFTGCFTGVEGTSKINLSKKDKIAVAPTEEDLFLTDISLPVLKQWQTGKRFLVSDDKFRLIIDGPGINSVNEGDTITYLNSRQGRNASNEEVTEIWFQKGNLEFGYKIEKSMEDALDNITISDIPLLIDLDVVDQVNKTLKGLRLWTKKAAWFNDSLQYFKGRKFIEVTVLDVLPGNSFSPVRIKFADQEGTQGQYFVNLGSKPGEIGNFGKLFSLDNPKNSFKHISPDMWSAIQREELRVGMTKEECRLSKGNPSDLETGHNYSNAMEIWFYSDGSYLRFIDGLLVSFK